MIIETETFELKEIHIKLLQLAYVRWDECETGAPAINPKRPYGNSNVASDIAEVLGLEIESLTESATEEVQDMLLGLHRETEKALQIVLLTKSFHPGVYEKLSTYDDRSWRLKE